MVGVVICFGLLVDYLLCCLIGVFEVLQTERHGCMGLLLPGSVSVLAELIRVTPTMPHLLKARRGCRGGSAERPEEDSGGVRLHASPVVVVVAARLGLLL